MNDFHARLVQTDDDVNVDDVREWLEDDGGDPGYQMLSDAEITATSSGYLPRDDETDDSDDDDTADDTESDTDTIPKLSQVRDSIEIILSYVEHPDADKDVVLNDSVSRILKPFRERESANVPSVKS